MEQPVERGLLSDRIRNALTDEIASGELAAGMALDEQNIADRFSASRTPVREALRQLASNGLVEIRPRRGVVVTRLTPEKIMEMMETMAEVESLCVRLATYRITPLERSILISLHQTSRTAVEQGNFDRYDEINRLFHEKIYEGTHNQFLVEQALNVRVRLNAYRRTQLRQPGRLASSREEHDSVIRAMTQGDGDAAARMMRLHMLNAASSLGDYLREHDMLLEEFD